MKSVGFITLGCKVNIYESNAVKNALENKGYIIKSEQDICDAYIINTCSVTNMADAKSRKMIRKCKKANPDAVICVMGCFSQTNKDNLDDLDIDIVVGNGNKLEIVEKLEQLLAGKKERYCNILDVLNTREYEQLGVTTFDHTRAFVKIEDGCENFCTYCIIPYARGPVRCNNADSVIAELKRITDMGYKEVVLAGIHTGRYNDNGLNLSGLIKRILNEVTKLERLRLSSIEINEVDDEFIEMLAKEKVIAKHLHLPLQAGSDNVLKNMERKYDLAFFTQKVNKIRNACPYISLTTDIIVGFPLESDDDFKQTLEYSKQIGFSKIHVFPYSSRRGTKAAQMKQVNDLVKKMRAAELLKLSNELEYEYYNKFIGYTDSVIIEQEYKENYMIGHTSNYLEVVLPLDKSLIKESVNVEIIEYKNGKLIGKIL